MVRAPADLSRTAAEAVREIHLKKVLAGPLFARDAEVVVAVGKAADARHVLGRHVDRV